MAGALMPVSGSTVTNSHHCTNTFILLQDVFLGRRECQSETGGPLRCCWLGQAFSMVVSTRRHSLQEEK